MDLGELATQSQEYDDILPADSVSNTNESSCSATSTRMALKAFFDLDRLTDPLFNVKQTKLHCKVSNCRQAVTANRSTNTNLVAHARKHHREFWAMALNGMAIPKNSSSSNQLTIEESLPRVEFSFKQEKFNELLIEWIVENEQPFLVLILLIPGCEQ